MKNTERIELLVKLLLETSGQIDHAVKQFAKDEVITINEISAIEKSGTKFEIQQQKLIEILIIKVSDDNPKDENFVKIIAYFKSLLYLPKKTLKEKLKEVRETYLSKPDAKDLYPQEGLTRKGYAVIINYEKYVEKEFNRDGADKDELNMTTALKNFGFTVELLKDLTGSELKTGINKCIQELSGGDYDSLIVVVGSHGDEEDNFLTNNNKLKTVPKTDRWISSWKEVVEKFNCPHLKGKPKIFLFNFCRGKEVQKGVSVAQLPPSKTPYTLKEDSVSDGQDLTPQPLSDILVCFSQVEGYISYRRASTGSYFLNVVSKYFESHGGTEDICTILCRVSEALKQILHEKKKQMCTFYNFGFSKKFYLQLKKDSEKLG